MFRQFDLRSDDHRLTCWLPYDKRLRVGVLLTLKGDPEARDWEIVRMSSTVLDRAPETRWRVGGLL